MTLLFSARLPLAGFLVSAALVARQSVASIRLSVPSPPVQYLDVLPVPLLGGLEEETRLVSTFLCHLAPPIEVLSVIVVVGNMQFLRQAQITGPLSLAVGRGVGEYGPLYVRLRSQLFVPHMRWQCWCLINLLIR